MSLVFGCLLALLLVGPASAGTIGFVIRSTVDTANGLELKLELKNTGNEAAHNVKPTVDYGELSASGEPLGLIAPGATNVWTLAMDDERPGRGVHAMVVSVHYEDANAYPFEVLAVAPFSVDAQPRPTVDGTIAVPALPQNGTAQGNVTVVLPKNRSGRFRVQVALPGGLKTSQAIHTISAQQKRRFTLPLGVRNASLLEGTFVNVFALVTSLDEDPPQTDVIQGTVRVVAPAAVIGPHTFQSILAVLILYLVVVEILTGLRPWRPAIPSDEGLWGLLTELALVAAPTGFLLYHYPWDVLLADTITAGGDMASLYYPTKLMAEEILPRWEVTGWTMGNYAGFPVFHFYSTLPFVLIALLGHVMPMTIAFKLVTLTGPTLLPLAAAYLMRTLGYGRGAPVLAAVSVLPFVMQQGNSMWGGNIPSVLAGEFCHAIGITLSLVFLGMVHKLVEGRGSWPRAALLLAAIGLSHTFAFLPAVWFALFYLWPRSHVTRTAPVIATIFACAGLLLCFWGLPLPARLVYTTEWSMIWRIKEWTEVVPQPLWPAGILAAANVVAMAVRLKPFRVEREGLLLFAFGGGVLLYFLVPAVGFPDIRFVPIGQLFLGLIAADMVYWLSGATRHRLIVAACVLAAGLAWAHAHVGYIPSWLKWNYSGYEGKGTWNEFKKINDHVRGDRNDPRMVFEHSQTHNRFGSSRAFENLPLFSGRSTLEGVFHQASQNSPFIFYLQSEISERGSGPFPQYTYVRLNPDDALPHLRTYNVGTIVAVSDKARQAYDAHPEFRRTYHAGTYSVYEIDAAKTGYAVVPEYKPVLYEGPNWKITFHRWWKHHDMIAVPLVPADMISQSEADQFTLRTDALERLPRDPLEKTCKVSSHLEQYRISLDTDCPGEPHIIKVSYFPRWVTEDGSRLLPVSPGFMLAYPVSNHLEIVYRRRLVDWLGLALSVLGLTWALGALVNQRLASRSVEMIGVPLQGLLAFMERHRLVLTLLLLAAATALGTATRLTLRAPDRAYFAAQEAYRERNFDKAIEIYEEWVATDKDTFKQATALFQLGVCYSEVDNPAAAIIVHERLRFQFPNVNYGAGTLFHLARNYAKLGELDQAAVYADLLAKDHAGESWHQRLRREYPDLFTARATPVD